MRAKCVAVDTSGYTDDDAVLRNLIDEGSPFLQKPFSPDVLGSKVSALLGELQSSPPSA